MSVYEKTYLLDLIKSLKNINNEVQIISTGGTRKILKEHDIPVTSVEEITEYPSILGGRVKTLHPKIFGGILNRSENPIDKEELIKFNILNIDMVIVDLYPFQDTLKKTDKEEEIIEKIDIGGVSLIRAAAKNYKDILVIPGVEEFPKAINLINKKNGFSDLDDRLLFAQKSFNKTAQYELAISEYFAKKVGNTSMFPINFKNSGKSTTLRYGENPHQKGIYYGDLTQLFDQLNGKELSYNNLLDVDSAVHLMNEFSEPSFGILKHNNACGFASDNKIIDAWKKALAADPISAFGGVLITNGEIDLECAEEINKLFFEILIANSFSKEGLELLKTKKNRIILKKKNTNLEDMSFRTVLNGILCQQRDYMTDSDNANTVSNLKVSKSKMNDLIFASKICKHTKSNAIVLVKNKQLLASGCGQTSRVDALKQAILKAKHFGFSLKNSVMASDAFFPFPDCVEIAHKEGVDSVIQPGGSKNDHLSIEYCNKNEMAMIFTGYRHFKH